jgi:transposase InsO family protein
VCGLYASTSRRPAEALTISYTSANTAALRRPPQPKQYLSIRYTERLAEAGAVTSVGSKGDAFHNALAATTIGLYKTELIHPHDPGAAWTTSSWRCWPTSTGATSPAAQRHWACPAG